MTVKIFARPKHKMWIESLGYQYCHSPQMAATDADILSPHLGLGANQCNVGLIDETLLRKLKDDALVINFDRGELIDVNGLKAALKTTKVGHVVVDADIFIDENGLCNGPLQAYRALCDDFSDKLMLLPHVAADIDHLSRVAGAKQAIKQLITAITDKIVINGVEQAPVDYQDAGKQTLAGIGAVSDERFDALDAQQVAQIAELSKQVAQFWQDLADARHSDDKCDSKNNASLEQVTLMHNQLSHLLTRYGLIGTVN